MVSFSRYFTVCITYQPPLVDVVCTGFIWFVTVEWWAVVNVLMNFFGSTQVEKFVDWLRAATFSENNYLMELHNDEDCACD
jgi:hypothetical protein